MCVRAPVRAPTCDVGTGSETVITFLLPPLYPCTLLHPTAPTVPQPVRTL